MGNKVRIRIKRTTLLSRMKEVLKKKGVFYIFKNTIKRLFSYYYFKIFKSHRKFKLQGKNYSYFCNIYNATWKNERAVEISISNELIKKYKNKKVLEVGNVLSHYSPVTHDILDKYEKSKGIINKDIVDFKPSKKYDLIISISTLEHVGFDEKPKDKNKIMLAVKNLKKMLAKNGEILITVPTGYNPYLDKILKKNKIKFTKKYCLKRISKDNKWVEVKWQEIKNSKYNKPFLNANGLFIGIIKK